MENFWRQTIFTTLLISISLQCHKLHAQVIESTTMDLYTDSTTVVDSTTQQSTTQDPDQCSMDVLNNCDLTNGYCVDTSSGYTCGCNDGFQLALNQFDCEDDEPPVLKCPDDQVHRVLVGESTVAVTWTIATATDNVEVDGAVYQISNEIHGDFEVGTYMITFGAMDINGLEGMCTFSIVVEDTQCANSFLRCPVTDGECISEHKFCDLEMDCPDWSDENELSCRECLSSETRCDEAYCIETDKFCDESHNDCPYDDFDETSSLCDGSCLSPDTLNNGEQTFPEPPHRRRYLNNQIIIYVCDEGYTMTGDSQLTCTDGSFGDDNNLPKCFAMCSRPDAPSNGAVTGSEMTDHGDTIEFSCDTGYELQPSTPTTFTCDDGSFGDGVSKRCTDINECEQSSICDSNAVCSNAIGTYSCECVDGYEGDGSSCSNVDECALDPSSCSENAMCTDSVGSYTCECDEGFNGDGFFCIEILYFDYGTDIGDSSLRETSATNGETTKSFGEFLSILFKPATGFPFGDSFLTNVYFTENGIFILVNDDEDIVAYSKPPTTGFESDDTRNIIAPFWTDGDMSTDIGDVLFQEYKSDDTDDVSFLAEILAKLTSLYQEVLPTDFSPTWALKVTWTDIAQRPADASVNRRNTFQSTIMTDGLYSFGMFLYEEGDMLWDPDLENPQDATIGYNIRSEGPVNIQNGQYRPDENTGNTGMLGQWVFRFESNTEDTINPKKQCLEWYAQDVTEFVWTSDLGTCPCSLLQAARDGRYSLSRLISVVDSGIGRGDSVNTALEELGISSSVFTNVVMLLNDVSSYAVCFQSSTFNFYLSGTQCCYRLTGFALIEGYLGIGSSSFVYKYGYNFGNWLIFSQYIKHIAYDLMPQYYCCAESLDMTLCDLYSQRRPPSDCTQYIPPTISWMYGDPHIVTSDGYPYTFNGKGEYICSNVDGGLFELQCRMASPISEEQIHATIFSAFTGVHTMSSNTYVQFTMNDDGTDFDILVNDTIHIAVSDLMSGQYSSMDDPDFSLYIREESDINPGVTRVYASWGSGIAFGIALQEKMLDVLLEFPAKFKGNTSGLFGIWNDDISDDLCSPSMDCLDTTTTLQESDIFDTCNLWRLTKSESAFDYPPGMSYEDFNDEDFVPMFLDQLMADADQDLLELATATCGLNEECLFDSLATKDVEVGMLTQATGESNNEDQITLENIPPIIDQIVDASSENLVGQFQLNVRVNETVTLTIEASDENDDTLTYELENAVPGATLDSQSGEFTWTPTNTDMVSVTFLVSDGSQTTSAVMEVRICACLNGGVCNFDGLLYGSDIANNKFAIVQCDCTLAWTGYDCSEDYDACEEEPCHPGVICKDHMAPDENATCGACPNGLSGDGYKCYDYDECTAGMDQDDQVPFCEHTELCVNTLGSYECNCRSGYELHPNEKDCPDINECDRGTDSCSDQALCQNTIGSHNCTCNDGYEGDGETCEDIDECQTGVYPCDFDADCENIDGSFLCTCADGYSGNGLSCDDIDECRQGTYICDPNADCINSDGSYRCSCRDGFNGNSTYCVDVDECIERALDCHPKSDCTNTIGSYMCVCPSGYRGDGYTCVDVDECAESDDLCPELEECVNTDASYFCRCVTGYARATEDAECTDVDECIPVNGTGPCSINAECTNNDGSFACGCGDGYSGDGYACLDIDECTVGTDECDHTCANTAGSYTCDCMDGFELGTDMLSCDPLPGNVCPDLINECDASATCVTDGEGNPQCFCDRGYMLVNMGCENIDECAMNQDNCDATNGNCTDADGSYNCSCTTGYELLQDLRTCGDIDECADPDACVANAQCTNTDGSFTCECLSGYTGLLCTNINECGSNSLNDCGDNADCEDTDGGYRCTCQTGYTGDGYTCIDVNECLAMDACHELATCTNTLGTFTCTCFDGYSGDGIDTCTNNNECNDSPCNVNADCTDLPGTYTCACRTGYRGDGFTTCDNIDECAEQVHICSEQAMCYDTDGSYNCLCIVGYEGNGVNCTDVDECQVSTDECDVNAVCNNTIGSYTCFCNMGYASDEGGNARAGTCNDYDECVYNIDDCSDFAICTNSIGSYTCECKSGFDGDGLTCTDTNECDRVINPCDLSNNEKCVNTEGNFLCNCQTTYFNISGECTRSVSKTLIVDFLYIKGWSTDLLFSSFQFDDVKVELAADMDALFTMSTLEEYYFGTVADMVVNSTNGIEVTFTVNFNYQYNVTDEEILEVFLNGLTGTNMDILEPDSQIIREMVDVQEPEINPCVEDTDDCSARLFLECVYQGNEQYTCQTCFDGYELSADDECVDINECDEDPCGSNEVCINSVGDYTCVCDDGYVEVSSGCLASRSFRGEIRVVEVNASEEMAVWDPQLEDPTSELYQSYAEHMCIIINYAYSTILSTSTTFYDCSILGFKEGSIIVVYEIEFLSNTTAEGDELLDILLNETDINERLYSENDVLSITVDLSYEATGENLPIVCEDDYCYNGGNCSINSLLEKVCSCVDTFPGDRCEECPTGYCNGGNCSTSEGVLSCSCPEYFTGERCESVDCPAEYCQNGGTCSITQDDPVPICSCPEYFTGDICESVACPVEYCQNGGTCSITLDNPVPICSCPEYFNGDICDSVACPANYCQNGGTCSITLDDPVPICSCPEYYTGDICESVACPVEYCQNGGTCSITLDNPVPICSCPTDYKGDKCQTKDGGTDNLLLIGVIIGSLVAFLIILILMVCCFIVIIRRRRQPLKKYTAQPRGFVVRNPNSGSMFSSRDHPFAQTAESISGYSSVDGEDSRLLHLAHVLRNAPHLTNHMRLGTSEATDSVADTSNSEFIRPYVATGMEASSLSEEEEYGSTSNRRTRRTMELPHAFGNIHAFDQNRPSTSRNMDERHHYYF